jgi:hypothetical protein
MGPQPKNADRIPIVDMSQVKGMQGDNPGVQAGVPLVMAELISGSSAGGCIPGHPFAQSAILPGNGREK